MGTLPGPSSNTPVPSERALPIAKTGFLLLPRELRNEVYRIALVKPTSIGTLQVGDVASEQLLVKDAAKWRNLNFSISYRQVYQESTEISLGENVFEMYYMHTVPI